MPLNKKSLEGCEIRHRDVEEMVTDRKIKKSFDLVWMVDAIANIDKNCADIMLDLVDFKQTLETRTTCMIQEIHKLQDRIKVLEKIK